jgi:hypothetical protein
MAIFGGGPNACLQNLIKKQKRKTRRLNRD